MLTRQAACLHIRPHAKHSRLTIVYRTCGSHNAADSAILHADIHDFRLFDFQIGGIFQAVLHFGLIRLLIRLRAQGIDRRALACVQHFCLDIGFIDDLAHLAAQGIHLTHQMPLGAAPDGGIAGHHSDTIQRNGKQHRSHAEACRRKCRLTACMTAADNGNIYGFCMIHIQNSSLFGLVIFFSLILYFTRKKRETQYSL